MQPNQEPPEGSMPSGYSISLRSGWALDNDFLCGHPLHLTWPSNPLRSAPQGPTEGPTSYFRWLTKAKGQPGFGRTMQLARV